MSGTRRRRAARDLGDHGGHPDPAVPRHDDRSDPGGLRGAQAGPQVARILDAVEDQEEGWAIGGGQYLGEDLLVQTLARPATQHDPLMAEARSEAIQGVARDGVGGEPGAGGELKDLAEAQVLAPGQDPQLQGVNGGIRQTPPDRV